MTATKQRKPKRTPADLVIGQVYSAADIAEMFGLTEARVKKGGIIPVPMKRTR